jgi:hypothetical protein
VKVGTPAPNEQLPELSVTDVFNAVGGDQSDGISTSTADPEGNEPLPDGSVNVKVSRVLGVPDETADGVTVIVVLAPFATWVTLTVGSGEKKNAELPGTCVEVSKVAIPTSPAVIGVDP